MPDPVAGGYPGLPPNERKLLDQIEKAEDAAQNAWKKFSMARDTAGLAHTLKNAEVITHLERLQAEYDAAAERVEDVKGQFRVVGAKSATGPSQPPPFGDSGVYTSNRAVSDPDDPGAGIKAWGKAVVSRLTETKALDATSGGSVPAYFDAELRRIPWRSMFVRSLIPTVPIESDKAQYVRQSVRTNNAAPVAAGGTKPTSVFTIERIEAPVTTIAHVSEPIDRSLLMDFEQLNQFLSDELRLGVLLAEENQLINGSGTAPNLRGILNTSGIGTVALGADTRPDAIHKAMTTVRSAFYVPDGVVLHPNDWEQVRLLKDGQGLYVFGPATEAGTERMFGAEVIVSPVIAEGTALVGAFRQGALLFDREQARVDFSESHASLFVTNQIIARGEERIAFGVTRPAAFCTVTGI